MGMILQKAIDDALYDPLSSEYAAVKAAVDAAIVSDSTVGAAVRNAGLYDGPDRPHRKRRPVLSLRRCLPR